MLKRNPVATRLMSRVTGEGSLTELLTDRDIVLSGGGGGGKNDDNPSGKEHSQCGRLPSLA
ncbi:hypothetical protein E4U43_006528 [Claviceps pusilla]|uniref:Uncharacterized protein n=1 Tax=Claviceps pusilla TaxID=123648 RepID=A0A9P7SYL3_9HYPO|nr:hypothetical protein E4U43_006528 [Claviceps pusilla]